MRKNRYFIQVFAISLFTLFGCAKEAQVESAEEPLLQTEVQEGHYMTLSLNLPAATKMTHELDGTTVKTKWEVGDRIRVINGAKFNDGTWEILQASDITNNGHSAIFTSTNTTVESDTNITIYYYTPFKNGSNMGETYDFHSQDGTFQNLPEILVLRDFKISAGAKTLTSALTRFHFHFDQSTNPGMVVKDGSFSSVTLKKVWGSDILAYSHNVRNNTKTEGDIIVTPESEFTVSKDGTWSIDFYVAAFIEEDSSPGRVLPLYCLTFNPSDPSGISYEYNWYPTKTYSTTKVYKASPKFNGFKIPQGKRLTLNYTTTNASPAGYYSYWRMLMYNGTESGHFSDLRCDYWNNVTNNRDYMFSTDNFTNYHTILNGGTTVMTIDNSSHGYTFVQSTSSHAGTTEEVYSQTYAHSASDYIRIKLLPDGSTITMNSAALVNIPTSEDVVSVSSPFTSKYEGVAGKICLNPAFIPVTATYADSHVSTVSDGIGQYQILPANGIIDYGGNAVIHFRGDNALTGNVPTATQSTVLSGASITSLGETTTGFTKHSSVRWTVPAGQSQTVGVKVTADLEQSWPLPGVILLKDNVAVADGANEHQYAFYRLDNWWGEDNPNYANPTLTTDGFGGNDVFATIKSNLNNSTLYITVCNKGTGMASIRYYFVGSDEKVYKVYADNIEVENGPIYFCLASEYDKLSFE